MYMRVSKIRRGTLIGNKQTDKLKALSLCHKPNPGKL